MLHDSFEAATIAQVSPRAVIAYAEGLGWSRVPSQKRQDIAVFHRPDSRVHQIIIPTDPTLEDFGDVAGEAIRKLASFEKKPVDEVLEHLLLPPADVLRFREVSQDAEAGNIAFDHAVRMITGTRRLLLSTAHSVLIPQTYHPRLSRSEAEEFMNRCRLAQTERGSFVLTVACPLEQLVSLANGASEPFTRRVTRLLLESIRSLSQVADTSKGDDLLDLYQHPGMSANLCESLLLLRPTGGRSSVTVSVTWSRALLPSSLEMESHVRLDQDVFDVAEALAPRLRALPEPKLLRFFGFVDALRGQPSKGDPRPFGEVDFTLFDDQEGEIHARGLLDVDLYSKAGDAHLASKVVSFKGVLRRLPRVSRIESITDFEVVQVDE